MKILNLSHDQALFLHVSDKIIRCQTLHRNLLTLKILSFDLFKKKDNFVKIFNDVFNLPYARQHLRYSFGLLGAHKSIWSCRSKSFAIYLTVSSRKCYARFSRDRLGHHRVYRLASMDTKTCEAGRMIPKNN